MRFFLSVLWFLNELSEGVQAGVGVAGQKESSCQASCSPLEITLFPKVMKGYVGNSTFKFKFVSLQ